MNVEKRNEDRINKEIKESNKNLLSQWNVFTNTDFNIL